MLLFSAFVTFPQGWPFCSCYSGVYAIISPLSVYQSKEVQLPNLFSSIICLGFVVVAILLGPLCYLCILLELNKDDSNHPYKSQIVGEKILGSELPVEYLSVPKVSLS